MFKFVLATLLVTCFAFITEIPAESNLGSSIFEVATRGSESPHTFVVGCVNSAVR